MIPSKFISPVAQAVSPLQIAKFTILQGAVKGNPWPPKAAALLLQYGAKDDNQGLRELRRTRRSDPLPVFRGHVVLSFDWDF